ncbi:MAG: hypothetical protein BJ554DRAFT_6976 [Olpidium bornovanus]|uniref:Uncharacterized protein n=1 Tax=Olpidium bornovanus TaxID=278681 RepID=A0A8H7ZX01_9FUNG|nr:MAG: hypothetical protein BJ554DRAFT_6976 [Olpidium bornovanus]
MPLDDDKSERRALKIIAFIPVLLCVAIVAWSYYVGYYARDRPTEDVRKSHAHSRLLPTWPGFYYYAMPPSTGTTAHTSGGPTRGTADDVADPSLAVAITGGPLFPYHFDHSAVVYLVIYHPLLIMFMWSYAQVVLVHPGTPDLRARSRSGAPSTVPQQRVANMHHPQVADGVVGASTTPSSSSVAGVTNSSGAAGGPLSEGDPDGRLSDVRLSLEMVELSVTVKQNEAAGRRGRNPRGSALRPAVLPPVSALTPPSAFPAGSDASLPGVRPVSTSDQEVLHSIPRCRVNRFCPPVDAF